MKYLNYTMKIGYQREIVIAIILELKLCIFNIGKHISIKIINNNI